MDLIIEAFGTEYGTQFIISLAGIFEIFCCVLLFNIRTKRKKYFVLKTVCSFFIGAGLVFIVAFFRYILLDYQVARLFVFNFLYLAYLLFMVWFLYDVRGYEMVLDFCATDAAYMLTVKLYSLLLNVCGIDDKVSMSLFNIENQYLQWLVYYLFHFAIQTALGFIFYSKDKPILNKRTKTNIGVLTTVSVIMINILFGFSDLYQSESMSLTILIKILSCIICLFVLFLKKGIVAMSQAEHEKLVMNELFDQSRIQLDNLNNSVDSINSKMHDLKHQLNGISERLTDEEMESMKEAVEIYDSSIKTGNRDLDAILYQLKLTCNSKNIPFTCLCDGKAVSFIDQIHLYYLLNNAVGNAIEANEQIEDPEKRFISLTISETTGLAVINISNYYLNKVKIGEDGLPITSKEDGFKHGYGSRNIKYIVEMYKGTLDYSFDNNIFKLLISFDIELQKQKNSAEEEQVA